MKKSALQFSDPILKKFEFGIIEDFHEIEENFTVELEPELLPAIVQMKGEAAAVVELQININVEKTADIPFWVSMRMGAVFSWEEDIKEELLVRLLRQNAPALLLGYMRPLLATVTNYSPFGVLNLPFLDMSTLDVND